MIRKTLALALSLAALGIGTLWCRSAWGVFEARELRCGQAPRFLPGWAARFELAADRSVALYGRSGRLKVHLLWRESSHGPRTAKLVLKQRALAGFSYSTLSLDSLRGLSIRCPFWFLLGLYAAYPAYALARGSICHRHRLRSGCCITCGYNLTGNVSGRCPECGTATSAEGNVT